VSKLGGPTRLVWQNSPARFIEPSVTDVLTVPRSLITDHRLLITDY
jgi:hypothetical protein